MKKITTFALLSMLSLSLHAKTISSVDYGKAWPFTVEKGELGCKQNAVFFAVNGQAYAVNGVAQARYQDITPIWRVDPEFLKYQENIAKTEQRSLADVQKEMGVMRVNISQVLNDGLALCK